MKKKILGSFSDRPNTPQDFVIKGKKKKKKPGMTKMVKSLQSQFYKEEPVGEKVKG